MLHLVSNFNYIIKIIKQLRGTPLTQILQLVNPTTKMTDYHQEDHENLPDGMHIHKKK